MRYLKPAVLMLCVAALGGFFLQRNSAEAQATPRLIAVPKPSIDVYAVKFLCGTYTIGASGIIREGPVKPGNYQTAINIHNPNPNASILFTKKAVLMFDSLNPPMDFERPMPPGKRLDAGLEPDWGMEIDCPDIRQVLLNLPPPPGQEPFIKGWVVIEVKANRPLPLDVVAAYTSHGFSEGDPTVPPQPEGFSMQVLPVKPTRVR